MECLPAEARNILVHHVFQQLDRVDLSKIETLDELLRAVSIEMSCEEMRDKCGGDACGMLLREYSIEMENFRTPVATDGEKIWLLPNGVAEWFMYTQITKGYQYLPFEYEVDIGSGEIAPGFPYQHEFTVSIGMYPAYGYGNYFEVYAVIFSRRSDEKVKKFIKTNIFYMDEEKTEKFEKLIRKLGWLRTQAQEEYGYFSYEKTKAATILFATYVKWLIDNHVKEIIVSADEESIEFLIDEIDETIHYHGTGLRILKEVVRDGIIIIKKDAFSGNIMLGVSSVYMRKIIRGNGEVDEREDLVPIILKKYVLRTTD